MRETFALMVTGFIAAALCADQTTSTVEIKGPYICCKQCVRVVGDLLSKVDCVSNVKSDTKTKTFTFTAANDQAAKTGFNGSSEK